MTPQRKATDSRPIAAAAVGAALMLVFGLAYRIVVAQLTAPVATAALTSDDLARLPMTIGDWTGANSPLEPAMVEASDTDARISRTYTSPETRDELWLYVAYGVRARDLSPHRPEVCYVSNGWTLTDRTAAELVLCADANLPCNILQFSRGAMGQQKIVIIDYYIIDGLYCRDISALRSKAWKGSAAIRSVAQVQILSSTTAEADLDNAAATARRFAVESAGLILKLFTTPAAEARDPNATGPTID